MGLARNRSAMRAGLAGTSAAVILSLVLVGGAGPIPALGLDGAGIAMLSSNAISATVALVALRGAPRLAGRSLLPGRPRPGEILGLARVGIPLAATVLIKFAVLGVLAFAASRVGAEEAAVYSVAVSLLNLMFTAAVAVGQAIVPVVAERLKAVDLHGIRSGVLSGLIVAAGAVIMLGSALTLLRGPVLEVFSSDPQVRAGLVDLLAPSPRGDRGGRLTGPLRIRTHRHQTDDLQYDVLRCVLRGVGACGRSGGGDGRSQWTLGRAPLGQPGADRGRELVLPPAQRGGGRSGHCLSARPRVH
ncbi:MATE family efflux transporter [Spirillospora sp. NPDC050365]